MAATSDRMHDARDAEDALLLEQGDHATLVAAYYPIIFQRCRIRVHGEAAWDVAHDVSLRLLNELARGKRYPVPYRVVVHKVIDWTVKEHFAGAPTEWPLPDGWDAEEQDPFAEFEDEHDLALLFAGLPPGDREVATLRYLDGLEIDEIAGRLGKERNAIDQALWRVHKKLRDDRAA